MKTVETQFSNWTFGDKKVKAETFSYGDDTYTTFHYCHGNDWGSWDSDWFHVTNIDSFDNELASNKKWKFVDCDGQPVFVKTTNAAMKAKMREIKKYLWA